jgi:hypothetical protein
MKKPRMLTALNLLERLHCKSNDVQSGNIFGAAVPKRRRLIRPGLPKARLCISRRAEVHMASALYPSMHV